MKILRALVPCLLLFPLWGQNQAPDQNPGASGQVQPPQSQPPAQPTPSATNSPTGSSSRQAPNKTNDRLFYTLPNRFTVEDAAQAPKLTAWGKFKLTAEDSFDPVEFLWYGALAGLAQAEGDEPEYGQGARGYAKRYGIRFADGTIENFMAHATFASVLHQDPRYYQLGKGGLLHRSFYAVTRVFVTRSDSGTKQFNFSEVFGSTAAGALSTYTYHSRSERNLSTVMSVSATQVGFDALGFVAKEFWPDLHRMLQKKKKDDQTH